MTFSRPFNVKLASVGLILPPCGVPVVGSMISSLYKILALSQLFIIGLRVTDRKIFSIIHSWFILSKNPLISASKSQFFSCVLSKFCRIDPIAFLADLYGLYPKLCSSDFISTKGIKIMFIKPCKALSRIVGIPNGRTFPLVFDI